MNKNIEALVDIISGGIFSDKARKEVAREYTEHIEDSMYRYQLGGISERDAFYKACEDLGSPEKLRRTLANFHNRGKFIKTAVDWKSIRQHIAFFLSLAVAIFILKLYEPAGDLTVAFGISVFIVVYGIFSDVCEKAKRKLCIPFLHHYSKLKVILLSFGVCSNLYFLVFSMSLFPIVHYGIFFITVFPTVVMILPIFASVADKLAEWKIPKQHFWIIHSCALAIIFMIALNVNSLFKIFI